MQKIFRARVWNAALLVAVFLLLAVLPVSRTGAAGAGEGWSMFGHDAAHTSRSTANGPNSADLAWVYAEEIVGDVVVAPDGTIYGTSFEDWDAVLHAIQPDGETKWKVGFGFGVFLTTPAVAPDGTVYIGSSIGGNSDLYALDADGNELWSFTVSGDIRTAITVGPDGTIYFGTDFSGPGALYALNPNGTQKWKWDAPPTAGFESTAIAISPYNGDVVFRCTGCGLVSIRSNGELRWTTDDETGDRVNSPSIGPDGTIYIGRRDFTFRAFDPDDGEEKWAATTLYWINGHASAISADGSTIYTGDNGGVLYAFDPAGNIKWAVDTGLIEFYAGMNATPALSANGIVYYTFSPSTGTAEGLVAFILALRADNGDFVWGEYIGWGSSPVLGPDGTLYVTAYTGDPPDDTYALYAFRCADQVCALPPLPEEPPEMLHFLPMVVR